MLRRPANAASSGSKKPSFPFVRHPATGRPLAEYQGIAGVPTILRLILCLALVPVLLSMDTYILFQTANKGPAVIAAALFGVVFLPFLCTVILQRPLQRIFLGIIQELRALLVVFSVLCFVNIAGAFWVHTPAEPSIVYALAPTFSMYVFLVGIACAVILSPSTMWRYCIMFYLGTTVAVLMYESVGSYAFSPYWGRPGGFSFNPNMASRLVLLLAACTVDWKENLLSRWNFITLSLASVGVLATISFHGVSLLAMLLAFYFWQAMKEIGVRVVLTRRFFWALALIITALAGYQFVAESSPWAEYQRHERYRVFFEDPRVALKSEALDARLQLLTEGVDVFLDHPLLGWGSGYFRSMRNGPHNMYLARAIDNGILGAILYVLLLVIFVRVSKRSRNVQGLVLALLLIGMGFFTHNLLDFKPALLLFGLALGWPWAAQRRAATPASRKNTQPTLASTSPRHLTMH